MGIFTTSSFLPLLTKPMMTTSLPSRSPCCQQVGGFLTAMAALRGCCSMALFPTWSRTRLRGNLVRIRARQRLNQLTAHFENRMPPPATAASFFHRNGNSFPLIAGIASREDLFRIFDYLLTVDWPGAVLFPPPGPVFGAVLSQFNFGTKTIIPMSHWI